MFFFVSPLVSQIRTLIENDITLRVQQMDLIRTTEENLFNVVPVAMTNKSGTVFAKIDQEDTEKVNRHKNWRLTSSGYVLSVEQLEGKMQNTYMHKLVMGGTCKHLNGDQLDNRKSNLSAEFDIVSLPFKENVDTVFDYRAVELEGFTGYATVDYPNKRRYSGHLRNGRPDGYGLLVGEVESQQGIWVNGDLIDGVVTNYCSCECNDAVHHGIINCPLYEITRMDIVRDGVIQKS